MLEEWALLFDGLLWLPPFPSRADTKPRTTCRSGRGLWVPVVHVKPSDAPHGGRVPRCHRDTVEISFRKTESKEEVRAVG